MKSRELVSMLLAGGCRLKRHCRSSHRVYLTPDGRGIVTVPYAGGNDHISKNIERMVLGAAGLLRRCRA